MSKRKIVRLSYQQKRQLEEVLLGFSEPQSATHALACWRLRLAEQGVDGSPDDLNVGHVQHSAKLMGLSSKLKRAPKGSSGVVADAKLRVLAAVIQNLAEQLDDTKAMLVLDGFRSRLSAIKHGSHWGDAVKSDREEGGND